LLPDQTEKIVENKKLVDLSIIIPTYNESQNILGLLASIEQSLNEVPNSLSAEIIVVDDNSPDKTAEIVEDYSQALMLKTGKSGQTREDERHNHFDNDNLDDDDIVNSAKFSVRVLRRAGKKGLVSAVLEGIALSKGVYILVMDADFSHSPSIIPKMIHELVTSDVEIVVASRYTDGGSIIGWPFKRRLISRGAVKIAKYGLPINKQVKDPMSGFFALRRNVIEKIKIDSGGYKILLEILVKAKDVRIKEIPYTFTDRKAGKSKLDNDVIFDYVKAVYHLYRYGRKSNKAVEWLARVRKRKAVLFLSKAGRFYTVGASGLLLNYFVSVFLFSSSIASLGYIQATIGGIVVSNISNFFLNKVWTFEDRDFSVRKTLSQYAFFALITSGGAGIQLGVLHMLLQSGFRYETSLILAVGIASITNFLLNKKLTFREKVWG
jgi:dolichol-phosphate mannosyltransferase